MKIGGFCKFSLIDFPAHLAAVIFTQGCNFRCPYCHNPELVLPEKFEKPIPLDDILRHLTKRTSQLDGVVISGGEPTLQSDLKSFLREIKRLDYSIKLDSNGSFPGILEQIFREGLVDYIAMDIKAPLKKYRSLAGCNVKTDHIRRSISLVKKSAIPYQFRTTMVKPLLCMDDIELIYKEIDYDPNYVLQKFVPSKKIINPVLLDNDLFYDADMEEMQARLFHKVLV